MHLGTTFSKFIIEDQRRNARHGAELAALLNDVQTACKFIAVAVSRGALGTVDPLAPRPGAGQREAPQTLDVLANEIMLSTCEWGGQLSAMLSERMAEPYQIPAGFPRGRYLLVFDPLDGSSNLDVDMTVGTMFSILSAPEGKGAPGAEAFLQPGTEQVAAGYALYGPIAMLVTSFGAGVHGFTLDREIGAYTLTHPDMRIPRATREFAIDASNERFWERPIRHYVEECVAGAAGARGVDFNMRWVASMVAEVHRILVRGGLFLYPRDFRDSATRDRPRLLTAANPMAMLVEQAGGAASTGRERLLSIKPETIRQSVPVVLGSHDEVERLVGYHLAHDRGEDLALEVPLFNERSLFRVT